MNLGKILSLLFFISLFSGVNLSVAQKSCESHKPLFLRESEERIAVNCMKEDLKQLKENLASIHPQIDFYTDKKYIDSLFMVALETCSKPKKIIDFIEIVSGLLQSMQDSHTNISPLVLTQLSDINRVFPFNLERIAEKFYMQKCYKDIIPSGMECVQIDGIPVETIYEKAKLFTFREGKAEQASEQMALKLVSRIFSVYHIKNKDFLSYKLVDFTGDTLEKKLQSAKLRSVILDKEWNSRESIYYSFDSSGTASLELGSFSAKGSNGMKRVIDDFFVEVFERKSPHVFIDLRGNSGGYVSIKNYLINYLDTAKSDKRERYDFIRSEKDRFSSIGWWIKSRYKSYLNKYPGDTLVAKEWKYIQSPYGTFCQLFYANETALRGPVYSGKVSVAVNGLSMSASVMFSSWIQSTKRGLIYGEMCMGGHKGTFGDAVSIKLKHSKIPISMSTIKITPLATALSSSEGLIPDVVVKSSILHLKKNIDPIKEHLGFHKKNNTRMR